MTQMVKKANVLIMCENLVIRDYMDSRIQKELGSWATDQGFV